MATNGAKGGGRHGAVRDRSQFRGPNGDYIKRDTNTGRFMDHKADGTPFKGVTREQSGK